MSSWDTLKELVATALELPQGERVAYLEAHCGEEGVLREAIALATQSDLDDDTHLLDRRADTFVGFGGTNPAGLAGRRLGKYELIRLIGQGGMGAVYLARQHGVDRQVAIKVVPPHALMFDARSRFEREIQALGRIDHPGVARVFDSGLHVESTTPGLAPVPYFAMEWIDGTPLTDHVRARGLGLRARIELMLDVAHAVQAAHQRAVVHCDLKPANVLVLPPDGGNPHGQVKVVDFGLARLIEGSATNVTATFSASAVMGTLPYMAPEQARGDQNEIGFQTDVYALGALLHELVHGAAPLEVQGLSLTEALRRITELHIPALAVADDFTGGDLACVLATALAADKRQRYPSVEAFADDLRRLLHDEPIVAQPPTRLYRARKFCRRNRLGVLAAGGMVAALIVGFGVALYGLLNERVARREAVAATRAANQERRKAESARDFLRSIVASAQPGESGRDVTVVDAVRAALPAIEAYAEGDAATESDLRLTVARSFRALGYGKEARAQYAAAGKLAVSAYGPDSEEAITIAIERAVTLATSGDLDAAARLLEDVPERIERLADGVAAERMEAMLGEARADLLLEQGAYERAAEAYEKILSRWGQRAELVGEDNLEIWRMNYALALSYAGRPRDAEAVQRRAVEASRARRGPDHVRTLVAEQNLAGTLVDLGEFEEAKALLDHVVTVGTEVWGAKHPDTLATRRALATLEFTRSNYAAAADIAEAVLNEGRQIYPADAPFLLMTQNVYAASLLGAEDWERGLPVMRDLVDRLTRLYGHDHPGTLANRAGLAQALGASGNQAEAAAELRAILPVQQSAMGQFAMGTLITQNNLGMFELELGNTKRALELIRASLAGAIEGGLQPLIPKCRRNLGRALTAAGRYGEAETALLRAYAEAEAIPSEAEQKQTAQHLVDLYAAWGQPDVASRWMEVAGDDD